jgi:hypothetical protein
MAGYITTHARLNEVSLGNLGKMRRGTNYSQFMANAHQIAQSKGVTNPRLMLAMKCKTDMNTAQLQVVSAGETTDVSFERPSTEVVYPIADFEWDDFVHDIPTYLTEEPDVHVVDGDKFTAPI